MQDIVVRPLRQAPSRLFRGKRQYASAAVGYDAPRMYLYHSEIEDMTQAIEHETLHWVIFLVESVSVANMLDNLFPDGRSWKCFLRAKE